MSHFHYVTYKYVVIKDKRLGVAYYTVALLIVFYILMQLVLNKAYLEVIFIMCLSFSPVTID